MSTLPSGKYPTGATPARIKRAAEQEWSERGTTVPLDEMRDDYRYKREVLEAAERWASYLVKPDERIVPAEILRSLLADVMSKGTIHTTADDINRIAVLLDGE